MVTNINLPVMYDIITAAVYLTFVYKLDEANYKTLYVHQLDLLNTKL